MNSIHEIKARLDIVEIAGEQIHLQHNGKNWKACCPFHEDKTPSFVIFPESQRWKCFGIGCGLGGDLLDLVQRIQKWDFPSTLRYLAERAGVELHPLSAEGQVESDLKRQREQVFGAAMAYFQQHLFRPVPKVQGTQEAELKPDLGYALSRGWTRESLADSGMGSFGKDREELRRFLKVAGVDLSAPAAVALLGIRGDIARWADSHGITPARAWLKDHHIPGMPVHMLIYPHMERGRVVYLAGRKIDEKGHWNPPSELAGPRQPFYNVCWWKPPPGPALIVEGQGDALTLAQWGIPAVALAGCSLSSYAREADPTSPGSAGPLGSGSPLRSAGSLGSAGPLGSVSLLRSRGQLGSVSPLRSGGYDLLASLLQKGKSGRLTIALDADEPGKKAGAQAARVLVGAGLHANQIGLLTWPKPDANEWLQEGAQAAAVLELIEASPTCLDELIRASAEAPEEEAARRAVFAALAPLNSYELVHYRDVVCSGLKMRRVSFDQLLREARLLGREVDSPGVSGTPFLISAGCMYYRGYNSQGCEVLEKLSNFTARIEQEIKLDDGQEIEREFRISGEIGGMALPIAKVGSREFDQMSWALREWGAAAIIEAGVRKRENLRAAIQYLSPDFERRTIYTHTGWRELVPGQRAYLSGSGAAGLEGIDVQLDGDLKNYHLPEIPQDPTVPMQVSLQFLDLAPLEITVPLWASIWLAPLGEFILPSFVVWLFGRTGTLKSTLAALALNHFGKDFSAYQFPASFLDTPARLEHKAFLAKDVILVIDDYAPQKDARSAQEYKRSAHQIIRAVGNRAGRGRLTRDIKARQSHIPRGLMMITGEDLPESESLMARLFVVEFKQDSVDIPRLSALQGRKEIYSHAMAGYVGWLREHWDTWKTTIPALRREYRKEASASGIHLRLPDTVAALMTGLEMGLRYALSIGALPAEDYKIMMESGWSALLECSNAMTQHTQEEKPEELFLGIFRELLAQGKVYLREREGGRVLGGPEARGEMLGWYDDGHVYLLPEASYKLIARHFRDQGGDFPVRPYTLRKNLKEAGLLIEKNGRLTNIEWLDGRTQRVMVLKRVVLGEL